MTVAKTQEDKLHTYQRRWRYSSRTKYTWSSVRHYENERGAVKIPGYKGKSLYTA